MDEGNNSSYLANLKQLSSQRINEKFISTLHSLESTQPAVVSIFKKCDKIHKFSDFFPGRIWVSTLSEMGNRCTILKREATYYKLHFTKDTLKQTILQINYNSLFKNGLRKIKEPSDILLETGL